MECLIDARSVIASSLKPSSGIIHLEAGSFDPTYSQCPFFSPSLNVDDDYRTTGFAIIQLHERNGLILDHLSEKYDFDVFGASKRRIMDYPTIRTQQGNIAS